MIEIYSNNSQTTLAAGVGPTATSMTVLSGTGTEFPAPTTGQFFRFTMNDALTGDEFEVIYAQVRSGDTFSSLLRGQEGTTAQSWISGDKVYAAPTAGAMSNLAQQVQVQSNLFNYGVDTGSANAYAITLVPNNLSTPVAGALIYFLAAHVNTGVSTVVVNSGSVYPLLGYARLALQGNEIGKFCCMTFDAALASYVLLFSSGGAVQVGAGTASNQALTTGTAALTFALLGGLATQAFSASQLNTGVVAAPTTGAATLTLEANNGLIAQNNAGSALVTITAANGTVSSTSTQVVTGQQLQKQFKVGEQKLWHGAIANIASVWGPGWQLADGTNGTLDMRNTVPIGAGSTYAVGATGGSTTTSLITANIPAHNHTITISDPGHAHGVYDPGHAHSVYDPGHAHGVTAAGNYATPQNGQIGGVWFIQPVGSATSASGTGIGIYAAATGIGIYAAVTSISATSANTGTGTSFNNLPPYTAVLILEYTGAGA